MELHFGMSDTGTFPSKHVSSIVQDGNAQLEAERQQRLEAEQAAAEAAAALEEAQQQVMEQALATRRSISLQHAMLPPPASAWQGTWRSCSWRQLRWLPLPM